MKIFFIIIKNISILLLGTLAVATLLILSNRIDNNAIVGLYSLSLIGYVTSKTILEIIKEINIL